MLVKDCVDRLFAAQQLIKAELVLLRNHQNLVKEDTSPLHWHMQNEKNEMPFVHLLVTVAGATPMGSVQIEREFGEISTFY